jgi:hypothetical protein
MTFDNLTAAIDWLDAYRGKSLDLVDMYAGDATLVCGCDGARVAGTAALEKYWADRFMRSPATELVDVRSLTEEAVMICCKTTKGRVSVVLSFDRVTGKIEWQRCEPVWNLT